MTKSKRIGSALVVVGGSLAAAPASALELAEMTVQSTLGQPLRASIAYALAPNELVTDTCVSLQRSNGTATRPVSDVKVGIANGVITFTGGPAIREPVATFRVSIRCPYTPRLAREYTVLVDPPQMIPSSVPTPTINRSVSRPAIRTTPVARTQAASPAANREPISAQASYLVQPGDSLSLIAQRVQGSQQGWRQISDSIFAANPEAFIGNDPNRLKAGIWLTIPDTTGDLAAQQPGRSSTPVEPELAGTIYSPEVAARTSPADEPLEYLDEIPAPIAAVPQTELRPGDLIFESPSPAPVPSVESQAAPATSQAESISIIQQPERQTQGSNWLTWLFGGLLTSALGLFVFGRRLLDWYDSKPVAPVPAKSPETADDTQRVEALADVDFGEGQLIEDDSPTAENPQLDADLIAGTGLTETSDVDVAADFAFAATTNLDLDLELTEDMSADVEDHGTDIIPPINADESSILKSEILPQDFDDEDIDEDEDYDISVVIDATKMPDPADLTERDLEAIAIDDGDESLITGDYTLSQEVDYKILEQDYQDEMTATQALNEEIQRAAEDLAANLDEADSSIEDTKIGDTDINANATVEDLDVTAQVPANDDTAVNTTVDMESDDDTVEMPGKGQKAG